MPVSRFVPPLSMGHSLSSNPSRRFDRRHDVVLARRVKVAVLRMLGNVLQRHASLLRLRRATVPRVHIPDGTRNAGRVRHLPVKCKIISPLHGSAAFVSDEWAVALCLRHSGKRLLAA